MTDTLKHTPTPWEINTEAGPQLREIFAGDILIADCGLYGLLFEETQANAEFIVRAVNNHEALLDACKTVLAWISNWDVGFDDDPEWVEDKLKIEATIQEAKK